jgi:cell division protein FtsL
MTKRRSRREKKQEARRQSVLSDAQVALGWFVIIVLAALVGSIYVIQASRIAADGRRVQNLQAELEELKRQNAVLERGIAETQSLDRLEQEALQLGFVRAEPENIEYLLVDGYPADVNPADTGLEPMPAIVPVGTIGEALELLVQRRSDSLVKGESGE